MRNVLSCTNHGQSLNCRRLLNRSKSELGATTSQRINDATDVITNQAEARRTAVLFDGATEGGLGVAGEAVGFIQND